MGARQAVRSTLFVGIAALCAAAGHAVAGTLPFSTSLSGDFLIIGMGPVNSVGARPGVGAAIDIDNFEIGANKAPVPSTSGFLNGGSSGGPGLLGNVPNIPLNAMVVHSGICNNGNMAVTHPQGGYTLSDVGVYADLGLLTAGPHATADQGTQNSFFNDPNHFPNTFTSTGLTNPGVNNNTGGFGTDVNPGSAVQSTRMDSANFAGVTGSVNFAPLLAELAAARAAINVLPQTGTLNVSGTGGTISTNTTITLGAGLNVIDLVTGGGDFKVENCNLVIDGPAGAKAIFRVPDHAKFLVSQANILVGNSGIDLNSVLFYTDRPDNSTHFDFNNTVINGVAFWSLGETGGQIGINNAQGCTQLIADKVASINDVRFCRCEFLIPAPGAGLALLGLCSLGVARHRRN